MNISGFLETQYHNQAKEDYELEKILPRVHCRYIFLFLWGWLLNGVLLKDVYAANAKSLADAKEMLSLFPLDH